MPLALHSFFKEMSQKIKAAIIGASGYTGSELVKILLRHKNAEIGSLIAKQNARQNLSDIYPEFSIFDLPTLCQIEEIDFSKIDIAFCCLPHATSAIIIEKLIIENPNLKIIDLGADFRLDDAATYQKYYNAEHKSTLQKNFTYGLCEINRQAIKKANYIANPGCYPTSAILPLAPILQNKLISSKNIIIDSKSSISGAGKSLKNDHLFCEINENAWGYNIGKHRHGVEINQELEKAHNLEISTIFTPHVIPVNRGIISTIYVKNSEGITSQDLINCLKSKYDDEYFVNIVDHAPTLKEVAHSNSCHIGVFSSQNSGYLVIVSALDNIVKGASGQAIQNMNIMFGFDERMGF